MTFSVDRMRKRAQAVRDEQAQLMRLTEMLAFLERPEWQPVHTFMRGLGDVFVHGIVQGAAVGCVESTEPTDAEPDAL